jgi:NhaA family Na+:H+ antiporter
LFALANAGVALDGARAPWASTVGLGVTLFSWLAVRLDWSTLPRAVGWQALHGAAWLGGIGFTMALFIGGLAFEGTPRLDEAKIGILLASVAAGFIGRYLVLRALRRPSPDRGRPGEAAPEPSAPA